jgi:hypothetical protein
MMRRLRSLALAAIFGASLCGGCWLLDRIYPFENQVEVLGAKLRRFGRHLDDYDTLFIGSSRVHRQLSPAVFDHAARERGVETHSFNLGLSGMFAPEDGYVCKQIFAQKPKGLRQVFIEVSLYFPDFAEENLHSARMACWHDFERTAFIWRSLWPDFERPKTTTPIRLIRYWLGEGGVDKFAVVWPRMKLHLQYLAARLTNIGSGASALERLLGAEKPVDPRSELGPALDGYVAEDPRDTSPEALAEYARQFAALQKSPALLGPLPPPEQGNLDGIVRLVRAAGAEPILFIAPTTNPRNYHPGKNTGARVLDFSDPKRWPELFKIENRQDIGHLNAGGSELFTRLLAEEGLKPR